MSLDSAPKPSASEPLYLRDLWYMTGLSGALKPGAMRRQPVSRDMEAYAAPFGNLPVRFGCHHLPLSTTPSETNFLSPIRCSPTTST